LELGPLTSLAPWLLYTLVEKPTPEVNRMLVQKLVLSPEITLTQKMQLALRILTMPRAEFEDHLRLLLPDNPFLQVNEHEEDVPFNASKEKLLWTKTEQWINYIDNRGKVETSSRRSIADDRYAFLEANLTRKPSLMDHLIRQLGECRLRPEEVRIAQYIAGNLTKDGYLGISQEEICRATGQGLAEVEAVRRRMLQFDPVGVATLDLRECLLAQLEARGQASSLAARLVSVHLDELATKRYEKLAQRLGVSVGDIQRAARLIASLEPKPARNFDADPARFVIPDIVVEIDDAELCVMLNEMGMPRVTVNQALYRALRARPVPKLKQEQRSFREKLRAAKIFEDCVRQRRETLHKVACAVFERQREFIDRGIAGLKPLMMREVANELGVVESTVSRAVADKWVRTPQGLFPLRFFFQESVVGVNGEDLSNQQIKAKIRIIIAAEARGQPFSDGDIATRLRIDYGVEIARRTVAKYRDQMRIAPASQRRQENRPAVSAG